MQDNISITSLQEEITNFMGEHRHRNIIPKKEVNNLLLDVINGLNKISKAEEKALVSVR